MGRAKIPVFLMVSLDCTLIACLKKIDKLVSDKGALHHSAYKKLAEFLRLGYPKAILKKACARVAWETSNQDWISVRNSI